MSGDARRRAAACGKAPSWSRTARCSGGNPAAPGLAQYLSPRTMRTPHRSCSPLSARRWRMTDTLCGGRLAVDQVHGLPYLTTVTLASRMEFVFSNCSPSRATAVSRHASEALYRRSADHHSQSSTVHSKLRRNCGWRAGADSRDHPPARLDFARHRQCGRRGLIHQLFNPRGQRFAA